MVFRKITREELENLYNQEGITRKELRYLLRITPNQIPDKLSKVFESELNPFKYSGSHEITLRGFVHSPPKKLLKLFNSIHYELLSEVEYYNLYILSSSPVDLKFAIPVIIPNKITSKKAISQAHFSKINGRLKDIKSYVKSNTNGLFIIAEELIQLGFDELFSINEPALKLKDFSGMLRDRFNTTELLTKGIMVWLMSSPGYEGRTGGNGFSPISPYENKYKCSNKLLNEFHTDILNIPLPYFSSNRSKHAILDYDTQMKSDLKFFQASEMNYRYEKNLSNANEYLQSRALSKAIKSTEFNLSTSAIVLDSIKTRPLESFVQKPLVNAKVLTHTDLPILFTTDDLAIDNSENELFDYSMEITQLIYQSRLRFPKSPFDSVDTLGAVKQLMDNLQKTLPELHGLMQYGIIFDTSPIGGLGEHLTRISNSILRFNHDLSTQDALIRSEDLFNKMINRLFDEFNKPISDLYYSLEEKRAERDQIKTHKLRNIINSIFFELNNAYPDGWQKELFEAELKKRGDYGLKKIEDIFQKLLLQKEVSERSPGLYWHIVGFDRYL